MRELPQSRLGMSAQPVVFLFLAGNPHVIVCERGNMFGYQDLVFDPRNLVWLRAAQCPVSMDLTHTLQQPAAGQNQVGSEPAAKQQPMLGFQLTMCSDSSLLPGPLPAAAAELT